MSVIVFAFAAALVARSIMAAAYGVGELAGWWFDRRTDRLAR